MKSFSKANSTFIICHSTWTGFRINLPNEKGAPTSKSEGEIESIHLYMSVPIYLTFFHILPSKYSGFRLQNFKNPNPFPRNKN